MVDDRRIIKDIEAALTRDGRINQEQCELHIACENGQVELTGQVHSVAAKRLVPRLAGAVPQVRQVEDKLLVARSQKMGDKELVNHIRKAFLQERNIRDDSLEIEADQAGRVTLLGSVHSLMQQRLCEVLCWWVPAVSDVQNLLTLDPPEEDSDEELRDNLLIIFEKDQLVAPEKLRLLVKAGTVTLQGQVGSEIEKTATEHDCWYCPGVIEVDNQLTIG